jgi:pimeloyl-ACP methyl ester carboxylesterase
MNASRIDSLLLSRKWSRARALSDREPRRGTAEADGAIRFVELDDAIVRVKVSGNGPHTIIVTPDPPNVIEHYDALFRAFGDSARLVCFEMPGFGHSVPRRHYRFSLAETAKVTVDLIDHLVDLIDHLALGPSVLAFSCVAGLMALMVARQRPSLVSHVVSVQTPSWAEQARWAARIDRRGMVRTPVVGQLALALGHRKLAEAWYLAALGSKTDAPAYTELALRAFDRGASFCLASGLQALGRETADSFSVVDKRALCIWGTQDRTHRRTDRTSTLGCLPRARMIELDSGHFPDLEQPQRFAREVTAFLST